MPPDRTVTQALYQTFRVAFFVILYTTTPVCVAVVFVQDTPWPLLVALVSTVAYTVIVAHLSNDIIVGVFQFLFWLTCWFHLAIVYGLKIRPSNFKGLVSLGSTIIAMLAITILEVSFHSIVSCTGADLGQYGVAHQRLWEWIWKAWKEIRTVWDAILVAVFRLTFLPETAATVGLRDASVPGQVVTGEASDSSGDQSGLLGSSEGRNLDLEASLFPPPYTRYVDFAQFSSSQSDCKNSQPGNEDSI